MSPLRLAVVPVKVQVGELAGPSTDLLLLSVCSQTAWWVVVVSCGRGFDGVEQPESPSVPVAEDGLAWRSASSESLTGVTWLYTSLVMFAAPRVA